MVTLPRFVGRRLATAVIAERASLLAKRRVYAKQIRLRYMLRMRHFVSDLFAMSAMLYFRKYCVLASFSLAVSRVSRVRHAKCADMKYPNPDRGDLSNQVQHFV